MHLSFVRVISLIAVGIMTTAGAVDQTSEVRLRPGVSSAGDSIAGQTSAHDDRAWQILSFTRQAIRNQAMLIRINEGLLQGLEDDHGNLPVRNWEPLGQAAYRATWLRIKSQVDTANVWIDRYNG